MISSRKFRTTQGFYIGDICYPLADTQYEEMWGTEDYKDGEYTTKGHGWAVYGTAYGDGSYYGGGYEFSVDAGVIGIIPLELITDEEKLEYARELGYIVKGELTANFETDGEGFFEIEIYNRDNKSIEQFDIDTRLEDDEWF